MSAHRARAGSSRAEQTRTAILDATERILVSGGGRALTLRGVAAEAGIALGNLQYHYRSLEVLIAAVLDRILARGADRAAAAVTSTGEAVGEGEVRAVVDALLADHDDRDMVRLFVEIWALASATPRLRRSLKTFYDRFAGALSQHFFRPCATTGEADPRAHVAVALLEGLALFRAGICGTRRDDVDAAAREVLVKLLSP